MNAVVPDPNSGVVSLRAVRPEDVQIFYEHQLDNDASAMAAFPIRDLISFEAHWTKILANDQNGKATALVDGEIAGNVVSFDQNGQREVGYWFG